MANTRGRKHVRRYSVGGQHISRTSFDFCGGVVDGTHSSGVGSDYGLGSKLCATVRIHRFVDVCRR